MALKRFQQLQYQFAAHLRDPENNPAPAGADDERCGVYRRLFFNNIRGFTENAFPVLKSLMDEDTWNALNRQFYSQYRCHSPYFKEISAEFVRFLAEHKPLADKLPFIDELAHYEWIELFLATGDGAGHTEADINQADLGDDIIPAIPVLSPLAQLLNYRWPVHCIRPDNIPDEESPAHLVAWRDADEVVRFMECNAIGAALLASLQEHPGRTGEQHIQCVLKEQGLEATPEAMAGGAQMLEDMHQKGIVLGARVA